MPNDYLLSPGQTPGQMNVSKLAAHTAPFPNTPLNKFKYFINAMKCASIHRQDGKRISFAPYGVYEATLLEDVKFLNSEIAAGHEFIREATDEEVANYRMLRNPKQVMREQVEEDIKKDLAEELLAEISSNSIKPGSLAASILDQLKLQGINTPRLQGVASSETLAAVSANSVRK